MSDDDHDDHDDHDDSGVDPLDGPLARALRAPGTPGELAEQERYLELFRAQRDTPVTTLRPRRHAVRRLGTGTALVGVLALGGSGVAAAYTGSLPEPLQRTAHRVLGPIGVPPVVPETPAPEKSTKAAPQPTRSASPTARPSASPTPTPTRSPRPTARPTGKVSPLAEPDPTELPTTTDLPTTDLPTDLPSSGEPTTAPTLAAPTKPTLVTVFGGTRQVVVGETTVVSGLVLGKGRQAVPDTIVLLEQKVQGRWRRVVAIRTDEAGLVSFTTPPVLGTTAFRLRAGGVVSPTWPVVMRPLLTVSSTSGPSATGGTTVSVATEGVLPGEIVRLVVRTGRRDAIVAHGPVGPDGSVVLTVASSDTNPTYVAVLAKTPRHLPAEVVVAP